MSTVVQARPAPRSQVQVGGSDRGDFVLNFTPVAGLELEERRLVLEEARRRGLGTEYNNEAYPMSLCFTVGKQVDVPDMPGVRAAVTLIKALGGAGPPVQYCFFPYPYEDGRFLELYNGDFASFATGVAS